MSGFGVGAQSAQCANVGAARSLAVPSAIDSIDGQLRRLEEVSGQLLNRISPLLASAPPDEGKFANPASACEFASLLEGKADRIREIADRLAYAVAILEF